MNDKEQFKTKIIETDIKSSEEFFQTKKEKYKPLTKDPKKNQKEVYEKKIGDEELNKILEEIPSNTEWWQKIDKLVNAIDNNPDLKDPENKNIIQKFIDSLKSGDIKWAFTSLFWFIKWVMLPSKDLESTFWFKDNKEIKDFLWRLAQNHDKMSITELENQKNNLLTRIESVWGIKRKLWLTYALSRLLDEIVIKRDPNKQWMKEHSDWSIWDHINKKSIAYMAQQVKPWDILAVNKSEQKMWDKLLTQLSDDDIDTSHVLIVTSVDSESWKITIAHSTWSKVNSSWKWVEINLDLAQYTSQFNGIAIATLRPPEWVSESLVKNVLSKNGKWYDELAAASTALLWSNFSQNNDKYNCVELISQSFPDNISNKRKNRTHPSQILQELKITYVTIAWKSMWWS